MRFCLPIVLALLAGPGLAQDSSPDLKVPRSQSTVDELVDALKPRPRTRSLTSRNLTVDPTNAEPIKESIKEGPTEMESPQVDLTVNFDLGSARLQANSMPLLEQLAAAMKTGPLMPHRFQIEGHTDARGSAQYNLALSSNRAEAVVNFLQAQGVAGDRLKAEGKGYHELLDPKDPFAGKNRRVRVFVLE